MINEKAEGHLSKARSYLDKGDEFYRKAKPEIEAAHAAGATVREMSRALDKSKSWVSDVLTWDGTGTLYGRDSDRRARDHAKQYLAEASMEEVERVLDSVPVQRRANMATALVAEGDVAEAIHADPEASKVHLRMTDAIVGQAVDRSTDRGRKESRTIRDIDASRHFSDAAKEMADGNAIVFAHSPEGEALHRCDAAVTRVKQYVEQYEEIRGLVLD